MELSVTPLRSRKAATIFNISLKRYELFLTSSLSASKTKPAGLAKHSPRCLQPIRSLQGSARPNAMLSLALVPAKRTSHYPYQYSCVAPKEYKTPRIRRPEAFGAKCDASVRLRVFQKSHNRSTGYGTTRSWRILSTILGSVMSRIRRSTRFEICFMLSIDDPVISGITYFQAKASPRRPQELKKNPRSWARSRPAATHGSVLESRRGLFSQATKHPRYSIAH